MAKVLLISFDLIGQSMAGPGIRYWEFAKALAPYHDVVLAVPKSSDIEKEAEKIGFRFASFENLRDEIDQSDVIVCQRLNLKIALGLASSKAHLIIDAYDPEPLEHLEIFKDHCIEVRYKDQRLITEVMRFSLLQAQGIICANEPQKDLWLGFLMGQGAIDPLVYDEEPSLRHFLAEVPFGLNHEPPKKSAMSMREKFGIDSKATVLLWGGGIWNWFDPLTLIKAVHLMKERGEEVKLVFMGLKHPNDHVVEMEMSRKAVKLATDLGLKDAQVFFNFGWTPYEERQSFLLESDIGVSTHFDHLETRYAFRTRMLDYLWVGLPVIGTEGDYFANLFIKENVGIAVPYEDPEAICTAIKTIQANKEFYKKNSLSVAKSFTWPKVTLPLVEMISYLARKPKTRSKCKLYWQLFRSGLTMKNPFYSVKYQKVVNLIKNLWN